LGIISIALFYRIEGQCARDFFRGFLRQPPETATRNKLVSIKDVAFRTSFELDPEKTEHQGPNRERMAGGWGESMVPRGALERCETGANHLETREKRKPVTPERRVCLF
jgi:hypothetical protein